MIEITGLTKRYGARLVLDHVSLTLRPGEVTLLTGPNGAGKSTLLRSVLGLAAFSGSIRVCGLDPIADGCDVRMRIGYMPQTGGLHPDLTVEQTMDLYAGIRRVPRTQGQALLEEAGLRQDAARPVGDLSNGMRQRLGFALALLTNPQVLVLDEPSSSLDTASRLWLAGRLRAVARDGRTVLVSTHAGQELFDAGDRRIVLEDGRVVADECTRETIGGAQPVAAEQPIADAAAPRRGAIGPIVRKELRDAVGNRWLIGYATLLGVLGLAAAATGLDSTSGLSLQTFGRTTATLMNLCLLLAPLVAVLMGAAAIAGEQDRGTLEPLLAQPLSRTQLLLGKHAGLLIALAAATLAGFLPAGILVARAAGPDALAYYLVFPAIAVLAAAAMAGIGLLISVTSRSAVQAQGTAVFAWFACALLYDLVLIGSLAVSGVPAGWLAASLVANPIDAARVLGVLALEPDLYLLGPAGAFLSVRLGSNGAASLLLGALAVWAVAPARAAAMRFSIPVRGRRRFGLSGIRRTRSHEANVVGVDAGSKRARPGDRVHVQRGVAGG